MRYAQPGQHEYEVQAALEFVFKKGGSPRNAYPSIVASGPNATILHYSENNRRMEDGDLLLIDAGCEWGYHAADITRTFPVNGRFTPPQRRIYEVVLRAQLAAIAAARPGARYEAMHEAARRALVEGLVELGLLPRGVEDSLAMHHYREFYMHGTGHWLGMDVHDVGDYRVRRQSRVLEPGMVVTVEPGLYFDPERETVSFRLREYSEEEAWERRSASAWPPRRRSRRRKRRRRAGRAPGAAGIPGDRSAHRGRRAHHRRRIGGPDRGHAEDRGGSRAHLRRSPPAAAVTPSRLAR